MGAYSRLQRCSESQAQSQVYALLCKYLETYSVWVQARDSYEQHARSYAYRAAIADLYLCLYPDLQNLIIRWLLKHVDRTLLDDQSHLPVLHEVVESHVINVFVAIVPLLSTIVIDDHTDAHAEIIALAEHYLYC